MLDRHVRQVFPPTTKSPAREYLSAYLNEPNIVLLGDPGSGKSHTFGEAASSSGGTIVTARQFLLLPSQELASSLFIDALDERRAGRDDNDIIDQIVIKLFATPSHRVRISCRDRDWLGDTDLSGFRTYFDRHGGVFVLQLLDLSGDEQRSILTANGIASPEAFLKEANERGLSEFLTNPQNLLMLVEVVQKEGGWPTTFKDLFERYTGLLLSEANKTHSQSGLGKFTPGEITDVAGAICALRLISDVEGISLENNTSKSEYPSYRTIRIADQERVQAALTRRLFAATTESSAVSYTHRTTAEFLAAKTLAQLVRNGFPIGRLQALLGVDGHPAAELRGLNAWLAVHLPEQAIHFVEGDPYGVLTYGDAASLTPDSRLALLNALSSATENDPWMRITNLPDARIAPLFADDTASAFESIIRNGSAPFPLRLLALQAIVAAHGSLKVFSDLETILKDESRSFAERVLSIDALMQCGQNELLPVRLTPA
jgi:predicted NACHT family NTPase